MIQFFFDSPTKLTLPTAAIEARGGEVAAKLAVDEIRVSSEITDPVWDDFLTKNPLGQFQQSSAWAQSKAVGNWRLIRAVLWCNRQVTGGFQLLWRPSRFGRIGYVSKGPVTAFEAPEAIEVLAGKILHLAKSFRLRALIVQPPDFSTETESVLERFGFAPNRLIGVISATLLLDLTKGVDAIRQNFRRRTRQEVVQARKRGITIRVGDRNDITAFFALMKASSIRQGDLRPNPSSASAIAALWEALESRKAAHLTIAEFEGNPVGGLFCIRFGNRLSLWKKGSDSAHQNKHPMSLLYDEALVWGVEQGCVLADWIAVDCEIADSILSGQPLTDKAKKSWHYYNLGFGAFPKRLPEAKIWFPNVLMHRVYSAATRFSWFERAASLIKP